MVNTIQVKRGEYASIPTLAAGELGFSTDATKQLHIGDGAANHAIVLADLFDAHTVLAATSDNTPVALTVSEQTVVGRLTGGNVTDVSMGIGDNNVVQMDDADAANLDYMRLTTVGVEGRSYAEVMGDLSGTAGADFAMNTHKITGVVDPTAAQDACTKSYADAISGGVDPKDSCRVATTAALPTCTPSGAGVGKTLTANAAAVLTVDGVATVLNDRILVKNQVAGDDNGIYKVTTEGTGGVAFVLTRAIDFDANTDVTGGAYTFICEGTANADEGWILTTNDPITVDTTALVFSQFSSTTFVDTFVELTDTPANYSGAGLDIVRVNTGANALEFVDFTTTYLDDTAGGTDAQTDKAPTSNVMYDHGIATTGVHGAGGNTLLHSASTIDGGAYA
jgi:hypothetical protein